MLGLPKVIEELNTVIGKTVFSENNLNIIYSANFGDVTLICSSVTINHSQYYAVNITITIKEEHVIDEFVAKLDSFRDFARGELSTKSNLSNITGGVGIVAFAGLISA